MPPKKKTGKNKAAAVQRTLNAACCAVDAYRAACRQHVSPPCQALLRQLCASAQGNGTLDRVALDARSASAVHLKALFDTLSGYAAVRNLAFWGCDMAPDALEALCAGLAAMGRPTNTNGSKIRLLSIAGEYAGSSASSLRAATPENALTREGCVLLGRALGSGSPHPYIHTLELERNAVGDHGVAALAEGLRACCSLRMLRLGHNAIGVAGAEALAALLVPPVTTPGAAYCALETLNLEGNPITHDGLAALLNALAKGSPLQALHAPRCAVARDASLMRLLAARFEACEALVALDLDGNAPLREEDVALLLPAAKARKGLQMLRLPMRGVSRETSGAITTLLLANVKKKGKP